MLPTTTDPCDAIDAVGCALIGAWTGVFVWLVVTGIGRHRPAPDPDPAPAPADRAMRVDMAGARFHARTRAAVARQRRAREEAQRTASTTPQPPCATPPPPPDVDRQ